MLFEDADPLGIGEDKHLDRIEDIDGSSEIRLVPFMASSRVGASFTCTLVSADGTMVVTNGSWPGASTRMGTMVLRERTLEMINSLLEDTTCENKSSLFRALDVEMCLKAGTVARIYYDKKLRFVRADIHQALEKLASQTDYDPCLVYRVGERIHHHMFGPGNVVEKVHKKMEKLGIRPERLQLEWISAAEGVRFAEIMRRMEKLRQTVTQEEVEETIQILNKDN